MSLKTRLNGKSETNNSFELKNEEGKVLAKITLLDELGATLDIATEDGLYIEKPSGWTSNTK